ncbi:MAG TPA: methyltransferase [Segetibacter sp.]
MSNSYFQFKQFTVSQEKAAMKVCTDACLFGAVVASAIEKNEQIKTVLDIGTGTGLLSLMLAQKSTAMIDAVEIDPDAEEQAFKNFEKSPFQNRLTLIKSDIKEIEIKKNYDLVISNPPFFNNDLKTNNKQKNIALHGEVLSLEDLLKVVIQLLKTGGIFWVLLPFHRAGFFIDVAHSHGLFLTDEVLVKQTEKHSYFRAILSFRQVKTTIKQSEIIIKKEGSYSEEFIELLKDYYLYL